MTLSQHNLHHRQRLQQDPRTRSECISSHELPQQEHETSTCVRTQKPWRHRHDPTNSSPRPEMHQCPPATHPPSDRTWTADSHQHRLDPTGSRDTEANPRKHQKKQPGLRPRRMDQRHPPISPTRPSRNKVPKHHQTSDTRTTRLLIDGHTQQPRSDNH
jgi:hypothetical protein